MKILDQIIDDPTIIVPFSYFLFVIFLLFFGVWKTINGKPSSIQGDCLERTERLIRYDKATAEDLKFCYNLKDKNDE